MGTQLDVVQPHYCKMSVHGHEQTRNRSVCTSLAIFKMSNNFRMLPEYCMVLLPFRLNTGTYAANLRTFVWPHREIQIFTMGPSKAKFPAGTHPRKLYFLGGGSCRHPSIPARHGPKCSLCVNCVFLQFDNPCLAGRVWTALHCGSHAAAACTAGVAHNTLHSRTSRGVGDGKRRCTVRCHRPHSTQLWCPTN